MKDAFRNSRFTVFGIRCTTGTPQAAAREIIAAKRRAGGRYVCVTGLHGASIGIKDPEFRRILNTADMCVTDGMPLVWAARMKKVFPAGRIYGPDLMRSICEEARRRNRSVFLLGSTERTLERLGRVLTRDYPGLVIRGAYSPPFTRMDAMTERRMISRIKKLRPDILFVGLGTPKQERFMYRYAPLMSGQVLVGVGAAFDFLAGNIKSAPGWMQSAGLEWLYRLAQEPGRLWKRYLESAVTVGTHLVSGRL